MSLKTWLYLFPSALINLIAEQGKIKRDKGSGLLIAFILENVRGVLSTTCLASHNHLVNKPPAGVHGSISIQALQKPV